MKKMSSLHCAEKVSDIDNFCYHHVDSVCAAGCDFKSAEQICDYVEGSTIEIRLSGNGSTIDSILNSKSETPFWIDLKADVKQRRFIWNSDGAYLKPELNDPLWEQDPVNILQFGFIFLSFLPFFMYFCIKLCIYLCIKLCIYFCIKLCIYLCIKFWIYLFIKLCIYFCIKFWIYTFLSSFVSIFVSSFGSTFV